MALLHMDGFESGILEYGQPTEGTLTVDGAAPNSGSYSLKLNAATNVEEPAVLVASAQADAAEGLVFFAFTLKIDDISNLGDESVIWFNMGGITHRCVVKSNGSIEIGSGSTGSLPGPISATYATSAVGVIQANEVHHWSVSLNAKNNTGEMHVWIDGALAVETNSRDMFQSGDNIICNMLWGSDHTSGALNMWLDDLVVANASGTTFNSLIAPHIIEPLLIDGTDGTAEFLGSDGNSVDNHLLVDEVPMVGTDYVGSSTAADVDLYTLANRVEGGTVSAVQVVALALNLSGPGAALDLVTVSNVTTTNSTAKGLTGADKVVREIVELDPDTAAAWTDGGVNALKIGIEVA